MLLFFENGLTLVACVVVFTESRVGYFRAISVPAAAYIPGHCLVSAFFSLCIMSAIATLFKKPV